MDLPEIKIVEVINTPSYEKYHYLCLTAFTKKRYKKRTQYLKEAVPKGLRKDMLFLNGDAVGMIEYAPVEASAYPVSGLGVWVMNCIWVLRRAKGHRFGRMLMGRMLEAAKDAKGFATIALDRHTSPWLRLPQMEYLGFRSIDSMRMHHRVKRPEVCFRTHLMWMPLGENSEPPVMDWGEMLRGVDFCIAHPLYRAERLGLEVIFEEC